METDVFDEIQRLRALGIKAALATIVDDRSESEIRSLFPEAEAIYAHSFARAFAEIVPNVVSIQP